MKLKLKASNKILAAIKKCLSQEKSKYHDSSNNLVIGNLKDETAGVAIKEIFGVKPKMIHSR